MQEENPTILFRTVLYDSGCGIFDLWRARVLYSLRLIWRLRGWREVGSFGPSDLMRLLEFFFCFDLQCATQFFSLISSPCIYLSRYSAAPICFVSILSTVLYCTVQ
jgi:hypothetical protein